MVASSGAIVGTRPQFKPKVLRVKEAWADPEPELDFVLPGLVRGTVGNFVGSGGTGKSFIMLATALGVGIGRDFAGIWGEPPRKGRVVFLSLEDMEDELRRRIHLFKEMIGEDGDDADENVEIIPAAGQAFKLATAVRGGEPLETDWYKEFSDVVTDVKPRLLVIDTLNRLLGGLSENDGGQMSFVLSKLEVLAQRAGCAIVLCHHASKAALSSGSSHEAHAARGSSILSDNARWQCNVSTPGKVGRFKEWDDLKRKSHVQLEFAKLNYGKPRTSRLLVKKEGGLVSLAPFDATKLASGTGRRAGRQDPTPANDIFKLKDLADA